MAFPDESLRQLSDEILQAMFWLRGEGLAPAPSGGDLARLITGPALEIDAALRQMAGRGLVEVIGATATAPARPTIASTGLDDNESMRCRTSSFDSPSRYV